MIFPYLYDGLYVMSFDALTICDQRQSRFGDSCDSGPSVQLCPLCLDDRLLSAENFRTSSAVIYMEPLRLTNIDKPNMKQIQTAGCCKCCSKYSANDCGWHALLHLALATCKTHLVIPRFLISRGIKAGLRNTFTPVELQCQK